MDIPKDFKYTKTHEWIEFTDDGKAKVGITDFAQQELGDIVYVNLPDVGSVFEAEEVFADIESVKTAEDIYTPVGGTVVAVNEELIDKPELVNTNAFEAWFVELDGVSESDGLMNSVEYENYISEG